MIPQLNDLIQWWWQWMSSMFWQVSLLILLVTIIDMAIRRWAWPQVRYVLWGLVFLKLVIPPAWQMPTSVVSWLQPRVENQISIRIETVDADAELSQAPETSEPIQNQDRVISGNELPFWQAALFLIWFAGMIVFLLMLSIRMARLRRRHRNCDGQHLPDWFHKLLVNTSERMKLGKIPDVVFSENGTGPAVYGIFRPVLLLPDGYLDKLSKQQATHVLLHELCHLKRGDLVVHWCCLLLQAVYWFNPLLVWTRRQMRHVCEICCDLSVADILREKTTGYRNTLLYSARALFPETAGSSLGLLGIFEDPFRLVSRLKWLEKPTWRNRKRKTGTAVLIGLVMVFCIIPMSGLSGSAAQGEALSIHTENTSGGLGGTNTRENPEPNQPMLFIEGLFAEANKDVDYRATAQVMTTFPADNQSQGRTTATTVNGKQIETNGFVVLSDGEITINGKSFSDIETATKILSDTPGLTILHTPKLLTTLNNEKCSIRIGRDEKPEAAPPTGAVIPEGPGFLLEITPQLLEDGRIHQHVFLELSSETDGEITSYAMEGDVQFRESDMVGGVSEALNTGAPPQSKLFMFIKTRIVESLAEVERPPES